MTATRERLVTTLWTLSWHEEAIACRVYRGEKGLRLRVESASATILSEPFEMRPRLLARTQALRESLKRRGWRDAAT